MGPQSSTGGGEWGLRAVRGVVSVGPASREPVGPVDGSFPQASPSRANPRLLRTLAELELFLLLNLKTIYKRHGQNKTRSCCILGMFLPK